MLRTSCLLIACLAFAVIATFGCKKPGAKYVGHFNGKAHIDPGTREKLMQQSPQAVQALESMTMSLDLKEDMTFALLMSSMGTSENKSGTWTLEEKEIVLHSPTVPDGNNSRFTPSEDGNTLVSTNKSDGKSTMTFTRG